MIKLEGRKEKENIKSRKKEDKEKIIIEREKTGKRRKIKEESRKDKRSWNITVRWWKDQNREEKDGEE